MLQKLRHLFSEPKNPMQKRANSIYYYVIGPHILPRKCDIVDRVLAEEKSERRKLSCRSSARVYLCRVNIVVNIKIYVGIVH